MSNESNWGERLKELVNSLIDQIYNYLMTNDRCEHTSGGAQTKQLNVKLRFSVKIK